MSNTLVANALTYDLSFGDGIERTWAETSIDVKTLDTVMHNVVSVSIMAEDVTDEVVVQHGLSGDLIADIPSIQVVVDGKAMLLTWQEAYNLSEMLAKQVNLALYG